MARLRRLFSLVVLGLLGCTVRQRSPRTAPGDENVERKVRSEEAGQFPRVPSDSEIPPGLLGISIRRGRALLRNTRDSLPHNVGSDLRCFSCHLRDGAQPGAAPLVGVYSRFPQYRARTGAVILIEDRVNDCFERSLNGTAIPADGPEMRDIVAYLAFISRGVPPPGLFPGTGVRTLDPLPADSVRGRAVFAAVCARCHGPSGRGTPLAPPVWGPSSFNIGAAFARLRVAAAFIRDNMPVDRAVTLTDQQAFDVAAFLVSRPRPDFALKVNDWPNGDVPPDVSYPTRSGRRTPAKPKP